LNSKTTFRVSYEILRKLKHLAIDALLRNS
jgi:hypothetical protein